MLALLTRAGPAASVGSVLLPSMVWYYHMPFEFQNPLPFAGLMFTYCRIDRITLYHLVSYINIFKDPGSAPSTGLTDPLAFDSVRYTCRYAAVGHTNFGRRTAFTFHIHGCSVKLHSCTCSNPQMGGAPRARKTKRSYISTPGGVQRTTVSPWQVWASLRHQRPMPRCPGSHNEVLMET